MGTAQQPPQGPAPSAQRREPPPTPWQRKPVTGELIPCDSCGRGVADYRALCPFCGAPTGRPEQPAPDPAPARSGVPWRKLVAPVVLIACVAVVAGVLALARSSDQTSTESLSPQAAAFLAKAMPALDRVMAEAQAGEDTQAASDWDAIGDMPASTPGDLTVDVKYSSYANAVRDYLLQDGSATLQQVQAAKAATTRAIAAVKGA